MTTPSKKRNRLVITWDRNISVVGLNLKQPFVESFKTSNPMNVINRRNKSLIKEATYNRQIIFTN